MKETIKVKGLDKIQAQIIKSIGQNYRLAVGVFGSQGSDLVMIAATNEFGTDRAGKNHNVRIPERSYLRTTFYQEKKNILKIIKNGTIKIMKGELDQKGLLEIIGTYLQGKIQEKISSNIPPENAPSTIKKKGSSATLIDTGRLRQSITYKVESK